MPGTRSSAQDTLQPATSTNGRTSQNSHSITSRSQRQTANTTRSRQPPRQTPDNPNDSTTYAAGSSSSVARQRAPPPPPPPVIASLPADFDSDDLTSTDEDPDAPLLPIIQPRLRRPPVRHAPRPTPRPTASPSAPAMRATRETARVPESAPTRSASTRTGRRLAPRAAETSNSRSRSGVAANGTTAATVAEALPAQEPDFVNRQADGTFLLSQTADFAGAGLPSHVGGPSARRDAGHQLPTQLGGGGWMSEHMVGHEDEEAAAAAMAADAAQYSLIARKFFTAGYALEGRGSKQAHEDLEETRVAMLARLREQAMQHLDETRWMFEPTERYQPGML